MTTSVYEPSMEWEYFEFPLEISNLEFEKNLHALSSSCIIKLWRDSEFKLKAEISGYVLNPKTLEENTKEEGYGSFAQLDTITGNDPSGKYIYELTQCVIGSFKYDGVFYPGVGLPFVASLHITSFSKQMIDCDSSKKALHLDWFICASVNLHYTGMTKRFIKNTHQKLRLGIDQEFATDNIRPMSSSWDFFTVDVSGIKCIVSKVPNEMKLSWADCFCIEYRSSFGELPSVEIKKALLYFLGFLFGTELLNIGTSIFYDDILSYQKAVSPSGDNVKHKCQNGSTPPVYFNEEYNWGKIEYLIETLFTKYLEQNEKLNLEGILWRFFQGTDLTVGVNLPVLSSALELLANNYLKVNKLISPAYIPDEEYLSLIENELKEIEKKLAHIPEHKKILNKIKKANARSANEKIDFFFKSIDLPLSKIEEEALHARNSMAHGGSDAKTVHEAKKLVLKTRAYETLFNRTFLRILGYNDYYIDYYIAANNVKPIRMPVGPKAENADAKQKI